MELYEKQQTWEKGQFLYRAGEPVGPILKIITGIVALSERLPDGRRQVLDFFCPGEICGYSETDGHYAYEGEAITQVTTCVFGRPHFKAFTTAHADLAEIVRTTLAWKLNCVSHHLAEVGRLTSTERVAAFLCWLRVRYEEHGMPPGEADVDTGSATTTAGQQARPGGTATVQRTMTATVESTDKSASSMTFSGPNGWKYSRHIVDPTVFDKVKIGDKVDITWNTDVTVVMQ